jgi:hypothetical protein
VRQLAPAMRSLPEARAFGRPFLQNSCKAQRLDVGVPRAPTAAHAQYRAGDRFT